MASRRAVRARTHANLALARSKGERRPGRRPMCRTGSVSIRPDSCGLLYAPQVLSFLLSAPSCPLSLSFSLSCSLRFVSFFLSSGLARSFRALCLSAARITPPPLFLPARAYFGVDLTLGYCLSSFTVRYCARLNSNKM